MEYVWFFINHLVFVVTLFFKCPLVRDVALAISRKDNHSACIFCDIAVGLHFCVTHLPAYCRQNAVRNRCARNLLEPNFNNKSECLTHWQVMYHFQEETHYTSFINTIRTQIFKCQLRLISHQLFHTRFSWWWNECHWWYIASSFSNWEVLFSAK